MRFCKTKWVVSFFGVLILFLLLLHITTIVVLGPVRIPTTKEPHSKMEAETFEDVEILSEGLKIKGSLLRAKNEKGIVLLLHGIRAGRFSMSDRALFLQSKGYSSLLLDFQSHGESEGDLITLGLKESRNVIAAIRYLKRTQKNVPIGVIGNSLGGASALLADVSSEIRFLILEAVFPDIDNAIRNRLDRKLFIPLGFLTPLVYQVLRYELDIPDSGIRPIDSMKTLHCPVFIISGTEDLYTPTEETLALYEQAPQPKKLWLVIGAAHIDLYRYARKEYEMQVYDFIRESGF